MSHQETYRKNVAYAEFLADWDPVFYARYADALGFGPPGSRVLDVGCGVGQVLKRLLEKGYDAYGVEVSEPNRDRARQVCRNVELYDGRHLPFPDDHFASAGALNVLEHVEEPEDFLKELVRIVQPRGRIVVSSPNFFRVLGFRDYHPRMRGLTNKWRNFLRLLQKRRQIRSAPAGVRFDRMTPIIRDTFSPDDDAIVATNSLEISFFLEQHGCRVQQVLCTDRYVARPLDWVLNALPTRYGMFNAFVVAEKAGRA